MIDLDTAPATTDPARHLRIPRFAGWGVAAAALLIYPLATASSSFAQSVGVLALITAIAATGWNILGGYTGQISFGHAVFWATGMYGTTLLVIHGWSPWATMVPIAALAALIALLIGLPTFRLRGHTFSIATLALGVMLQSVLPNVSWLGGNDGLSVPITTNSLWHWQFSPRDQAAYYYTVLAVFALITGLSMLLLRGRIGSALRAVRDDEHAAAAIGIPVLRSKLLALAVSAAITAIAGSVQVMAVTQFVDPSSSADLSISTAIVLAAVIGGAGSTAGPLLGAWVAVALEQYTRTYFSSTGRSTDLILYGALIVAMMRIDPLGLVHLAKRAGAGCTRRLQHRLGYRADGLTRWWGGAP
jgi:branched-chain amino acid transport system permease protein